MSYWLMTTDAPWLGATVDRGGWPPPTFRQPSPRVLSARDDAVLVHHSALYRQLTPGSVRRSLDLGAGPDLYPLMLAGGASRLIHAIDGCAANVSALIDQVTVGGAAGWQPYYDRCRALNPTLPPTMAEALSRVWVQPGDIRAMADGRYDLASMSFVAERSSEDRDEVSSFCRAFVRSVRPGGYLVAAFRERPERRFRGDDSVGSGCPIDREDVRTFFAPYVDDLVLQRTGADPTLPTHDGGCTGTILLTARRSR